MRWSVVLLDVSLTKAIFPCEASLICCVCFVCFRMQPPALQSTVDRWRDSKEGIYIQKFRTASQTHTWYRGAVWFMNNYVHFVFTSFESELYYDVMDKDIDGASYFIWRHSHLTSFPRYVRTTVLSEYFCNKTTSNIYGSVVFGIAISYILWYFLQCI